MRTQGETETQREQCQAGWSFGASRGLGRFSSGEEGQPPWRGRAVGTGLSTVGWRCWFCLWGGSSLAPGRLEAPGDCLILPPDHSLALLHLCPLPAAEAQVAVPSSSTCAVHVTGQGAEQLSGPQHLVTLSQAHKSHSSCPTQAHSHGTDINANV